MDLSAIIGIGLGLLVLAGALLLGHVPLASLASPEALLIVFGGTLTAVMTSFSGATLIGAFRALRQSLIKEVYTAQDCIDYLGEIAEFVRAEGVLALQPILRDIEIPFLQKGAQLLVDSKKERFIRDYLGTEIEVAYRQDLDYAKVFESAGGFAPTMGIIGAVIGLIHTVQFVQDPIMLGKGVASAFSATLYGVAISNLFLLPLAGKLRQRAKDAWFRKTLLMEGILSISGGEHPVLMEEKLQAFIENTPQRARADKAASTSAATEDWLFGEPVGV